MSKAIRPQTENKLNELVNNLPLLIQHEHLSSEGMEGKDISQERMHHPKHARTDQPGEIKGSGNNRKKNRQKLKKQRHNQETFTKINTGHKEN